MDSLDNNTTHVVICFQKLSTQKKLCDLVVASWLNYENNTWFCKYPKKSEYSKMEFFNKSMADANPNWKEFPVEILKEASKFTKLPLNELFSFLSHKFYILFSLENYSSGMRRLSRAVADMDNAVVSSDGESTQTLEPAPEQLDESAIDRELEEIEGMDIFFVLQSMLENSFELFLLLLFFSFLRLENSNLHVRLACQVAFLPFE